MKNNFMLQGDGRMKHIGVLGLQGGIEEHHHLLAQLPEVKSVDVKYVSQLKELEGVIDPGEESIVLGRLLRAFNMLEPFKQKIEEGLPVWGTSFHSDLTTDTSFHHYFVRNLY